MIDENDMGLIKMKGDSYALAPERFFQMRIAIRVHSNIILDKWLGYVNMPDDLQCQYWLIMKTKNKGYLRYPFAKNHKWWDAITSEPQFSAIADLPQIYITGLG